MTHSDPILSVRDLQGWYGKSHVLQGVSFDVRDGELITLLGRNGAGKTTTLRSIMGLMPRAEGVVAFEGRQVLGQTPHVLAQLGLALVPENRGIFGGLTVFENLNIAIRGESSWTMARIRDLFPELNGRMKTAAGKLSGGEQQMLTIARALLTGPRVLLLDEPTEGLRPSSSSGWSSCSVGSNRTDSLWCLSSTISMSVAPLPTDTTSWMVARLSGRAIPMSLHARIRSSPAT